LKKRSSFSDNNLLREIKMSSPIENKFYAWMSPSVFGGLSEWSHFLFQKKIWSWETDVQRLISDCTLSTCMYNICYANCLIMYGLPQLKATCNTTTKRKRNFTVALRWCHRVYDRHDNCSHSF
jgi:hypothetical protein